MPEKINVKKAAAAVLTAVIAAFFITDTVRAKLYLLPPVFCVRTVTYGDGFSGDYYGAGYKIRCDHDIIGGSEEYYVTLWILPYSISL